MKIKTVSIFHPFTPQAAGVVEKSVATYHSQPHLKAMEMLSERENISCQMEYLTPKWKSYGYDFNSISYRFYPVDFTLSGNHKKWKKQSSRACLRAYQKQTPDVTIINMSGHSSPFSHELAKGILQKRKQYIAMLGGQHYSDTSANREYYQNAHHILVHTELQKKNMEKMEMFSNLDIRVFPLGVNTRVFKPLVVANKQPELLYVGRIVEWKRVHLAIDALKTLTVNGFPGANLYIIGPVSSETYLKELKKLVTDFNLSQNVHFLGHKEHEELPEYFQKADLFMLPSDKETFGMVMIEAMACGTPVAGIDCPGGPADVITHEKNGFLTTPEKYSEVVLSYFQNPGAMQAIANNARQKVVEEYGLEATYKILKESVFDALK